jgi:S1-C subfamily serine protease
MHKLRLLFIGLIFTLGQAAHAESWYQWRDASGKVHVGSSTPPAGVPFDVIQVPDPIRWRNAPDMPSEVSAEAKLSTRDLYKLASQSVYWVLNRKSSGGLDSSASIFGSAVAISEDLAVTNCHVMVGAGDNAEIGTGDKGDVSPVELVAANYVADRCVIRSRTMALRPVAGIRSADSLDIGENVYAIGNPRQLERTLSEGLISGKRMVGEIRMLQTTAPISPGSSGGGLFDERGNLVGITTSSLRSAQSVNFAIPAEDFWQ